MNKILIVICICFLIFFTRILKTNEKSAENFKTFTQPEIIKMNIEQIWLKNGRLMEFSAYNVGDVNQTDDSPCIGATNQNLCEMLKNGSRICASNQFPKYSWVYVEGYGECQILDRMNSRYQNNIDIAMPLEDKQKALQFGRRKALVYTINQ